MFHKNETRLAMIYRIVRLLGFLAILVIIGYAFFSTKNLTLLSLLIMMFYSLAIPIYSDKMNSRRAYTLNVIAPVLGLYVSMIFWINKAGVDFSVPSTIILTSLLAIISMCVPFIIHFYTREMTVIKGIEKDKFVHNSGKIIAVIVLGAVIAFNVSDMSVLDIRNIGLMMLILGLYAFSSSFVVNSTYRRYKLDITLETEDVSKKIKILKEELIKNFPQKSNEINFLIYLLDRMTSSFISGDFERCFIDAVTIINDKTVVKSRPYREKILEKEQWEKFRKIRAALVHSEIKEKDDKGKKTLEIMSQKKVLEIKRKLYQSCIEIQKIAFEVVSLFCLTEEEKNSTCNK